jgi:hypothetical protein
MNTANPAGTRSPAKSAAATLPPHVVCLANHAGVVVGVAALSSTFLGLKLMPAKWHHLIPPSSTPEEA